MMNRSMKKYVLAVAMLSLSALSTRAGENDRRPVAPAYSNAPLARVFVSEERVLATAATCLGGCASLAWSQLADVISVTVSGDGVEGAAAGIIGDTIYVSHGFSLGDANAMRIYDIPTDTWSLGNNATVIRSEGGGADVLGLYYSIGGRVNLVDVEIYDPGSGLWSLGSPMPTPRNQFGVAVVNDRIHVIGGADGGSGPQSGLPLDVHEVYDPALDTWSTAPPLPVPRSDVTAVVAVGQRIYVMGGFDGIERTETFIYDTVSTTWSTGAAMPTARSNAAAGQLAGCAIVIGGYAVGANLDVVEIYDPVNDIWCAGPPKPTPSSEHATMTPFTSDAIYAIGSGAFGLSGRPHEALVLTTGDVTAVASQETTICLGDTTTLDGSGSSGCSSSSIQYRWLDGATPLCDWSPVPTCDATPTTTTTYTRETQGAAGPACTSTDTVTIEVVPDPLADAGPDVSICEMVAVTLDASGSTDVGCPAGLVYEWRQGVTVVRPADPDPTWRPPTTTAGTTTYTVIVSCAGPPGCDASDDVMVEVRACPLAVRFDSYRAVRHEDGASVISWTTLAEDGTLGFVVERAATIDGPFVTVGDHEARGPGHRYQVRDVANGTRAWYRVVEVTSSGRGDATPAFRSILAGAGGGRMRQPAFVPEVGRRRVDESAGGREPP